MKPKDEPAISRSGEDYLESILSLSEKSNHVRVTDLATEMGISKPSVHKAVQTLKSQGLVEHERYGSISLTTEGESVAKSVLMRHIVLKDFLMHIGVTEQTADEEACLIEHSISVDTIGKLRLFLDGQRETKK